MKITSWNVNSVRARILNIINYIEDSKPDILMLQEIKTVLSIILKELEMIDNGERWQNMKLIELKILRNLND